MAGRFEDTCIFLGTCRTFHTLLCPPTLRFSPATLLVGYLDGAPSADTPTFVPSPRTILLKQNLPNMPRALFACLNDLPHSIIGSCAPNSQKVKKVPVDTQPVALGEVQRSSRLIEAYAKMTGTPSPQGVLKTHADKTIAARTQRRRRQNIIGKRTHVG